VQQITGHRRRSPKLPSQRARSSSFAAARLRLLGGFALELDGGEARLPLQAQRVVAFLALHDRPLHRAYVSGRLWPDASQEQAHGSLRTALWRTRSLPAVLEATATHVALVDGVAVDCRVLRSAAERVLADGSVGRSELELLGGAGDLLLDWYDDWIEEERDQLRQLRLLALETACAILLERGAHREALQAGQAAAAADPLRETSVRALIAAHVAAGNLAEAMARYGQYRSRLSERLQLDPSPHMVALMETIAPGGRR